ncbi:energy transducer TonB [Hephaestia sp. GCM10023244]|uniref:energy transducer TonB n=1 Tax=unclassified Hephaestia TaxID=2631281 RepID=UPI0020774E7F|nr:energy transducer TonB [Hephaestia sp. MAHUQ-44]MCM8731458.1 energy transducer TonB [Hephaestia sp. MAHUQ-44]
MFAVVTLCVALVLAIASIGIIIAERAGTMTTLSGVTADIKARIAATLDRPAISPVVDTWPDKIPPVRSGNPVDWFGPDSYPRQALRENIEGTVRFRLTIDAAGHAASCTIIASSGSRVLDDGTCRIATTHAEFKPLPETGKPPPSIVQSVTWRLSD